MRWSRPIRLLITGLAFGGLLLGGPASAASANLSRSYQASGPINAGSIVSLDATRSDSVELANSDNGKQLLGVAVNSSDSLLAVDANAAPVQVATTGLVSTLVSTINGPINVGDEIAVSPLSGIGMKAGAGEYVIGLAQSGFNDSSPGAKSESVSDLNGQAHHLSVGSISLNIAIGLSAGNGQQQLNGLQHLAYSITGRTVSTARVVVSLLVAVVALAALVTLVYASIFGSIISIGRNPLAKLAVFRTLGSVLGMAGLIALLAGGVIFLLLQ